MTLNDHDHPIELSASWAIDEDMRARRSLRAAWLVASAALILAGLALAAVLVMLPLKREEPIALLVDKTTGFVQRVDPSSGATIRANEAMLQSLLAQYVIAREGFDRGTISGDYRKTALWSSGPARSTYLGMFGSGSGDNPLQTLRAGERITVVVRSVSLLAEGRAMVRFDTIHSTAAGALRDRTPWVSIVEFRFSNAEMRYEDRLLNPLGLQVHGYRKDAERPVQDGLGTEP